jgi:hypothetical protein
MGVIPASQARALFTQGLVDIYREQVQTTAFLRSFFPTEEFGTKYLSIEVERGFEKVAVDILRGTEGQRNVFSKSTEKIWEPPLYKEFFDMTQLDVYDRLFTSSGDISDADLGALIAESAKRLTSLQQKIERAYELQASQVLYDGITTLSAVESIDWKRKAGSLVDESATTWLTNTNNPFTTLEAGAQFIRTNGKSQGEVYNVIMAANVLTAFLGNTFVRERSDILNFNLGNVNLPQRNAVGAAYHGRISSGSYLFDIWTYPEEYTNSAGVATPYIPTKKLTILPQNPRFKMAFAAVPQLIESGVQNIRGAYKVSEYIDQRKATHEIEIQSAGLAIPVAIDQIYTAQVLA